MADLGVAILGAAGMAARGHLVGYEKTEGATVRVLCDPATEKLAAVAAEFGVPHVTASAEEAIAREDVQIISLCTPDHLHTAYAVAALCAGKHVLCEKPMCTTLADAQAIVAAARAAARDSGARFMVGMIHRFTPIWRRVRELYHAGEIGEAFFAEGEYISRMTQYYGPAGKTPWRSDPVHPQNMLLGGGVHPMDQLRTALRSEVVEVHAYANRIADSGLPEEDTYLMQMKFANGCLGKLFVTGGCRGHAPTGGPLSIYGTNGTIWGGKLYRSGAEPLDLRAGLEDPATDPRSPFALHWDWETQHFVDCIREGREPVVDAVDGARTVAALVAGVESARTGRPVAVVNEF
jgi:UDP-N-acetylglucosamine 3-dehydrogenase